MNPGFYKYDGTSLLYASNYVCGPEANLTIDEKDTYTYPVDGWSYFEDRQSALDFFGITDPDLGTENA